MEAHNPLLKKYYISSKTGLSGICKYSYAFYELVLKDKDYIFVDSSENLTNILSKISSKDYVHIEIGIFQKKEIEILMAMLNANYKNVAVTLHDPPLFKFPFYEFKNSFLNKVSKFYDLYINKFKAGGLYLKKIKTIYILSKKGVEAVQSKYNIKNVFFLPHIIVEREVIKSEVKNKNLIYFGFIGRNKGIEYALKLHERLLKTYPEINFYLIGAALGAQEKFYNFLKKRYTNNVHFLGYVPEKQLDDHFGNVSFSLMLFKDYKFYSPFSGSILYNLKKGKIVFTNNANSVSEIIDNGITGFYLSGKAKQDVETILKALNNKQLLNEMGNNIYNYLMQNHTADVVSKKLIQ